MFSEVVSGTMLTWFPVAGLMIFFGFMSAVYLWAFRPHRKQMYEDIALSIVIDEEKKA